MVDPYKLAFVNSILFVIFVSVIFFFRRKKYFIPLFLLLASLLPLVSLIRKGVHQSGDFAVNITKAADLYNSLTYGIFPVHWASLLNATYGYPLFIFTYPLPYYLIALFKFMGLSFISSEKIVIALAFIASGLGMYLLLRTLLKPASSLLGAILYLYAPYHLVDMHYRVALGETLAYSFLPFVFYFFVKLRKSADRIFFLLLIVAVSGLILSHQAISLVTIPAVLILPMLLPQRKNSFLIYSAVLLSLVITAFYWIPAIEGINHTHQQTFNKTVSFESIALYFISPWRFGFLYQGPRGELSFPIGHVQLGLVLFSMYEIHTKKVKRNREVLSKLLILLAILVFMLFPFSKFIWTATPFMSNFQFAYRLMLPISFVVAIIGAIISENFRRRTIVYLLIVTAMGSTILNWGTRATLTDITDNNLLARVPLATSEGEGLQPAAPKWRNIEHIWIKDIPKRHLELKSGNAKIKILERTPIYHSYSVNVLTPSSFVENTYYFPGWNLYVNGNKHKFEYIDSSRTGLIRFALEPGKHFIKLKFEDTPIVSLSNYLSILGIASVIGHLIFGRFQRFR